MKSVEINTKNQKMKILSVVGARPNFMKIAPFVHAVNKHNDIHVCSQLDSKGTYRSNTDTLHTVIDHILVHTGQHYDAAMSQSFFQALGIPKADINLGIGSGSHAEQVGQTMIAFEMVVRREKPDWVVVVGDVNATCACSITAKKEHVRLAHIEAGLRSRDMSMPEEINRLVTDRLSDLLFTPDELSAENLRNEGVPEEKIKFVGNIMIDTLETQKEKAAALEPKGIIKANVLAENGPLPAQLGQLLAGGEYGLMTMHRPSNVDEQAVLEPILNFLVDEFAVDMPLIWAVHPRTVQRLHEFALWEKAKNCESLFLLQPLGYHEMLRLNMGARLMLTDSGGLQEECCVLGTPCLTLRWNTERPVTLQEHGGASVLVGNDVGRIRDAYHDTVHVQRRPTRPQLWDGNTAPRIVQNLLDFEQ